MSWWLEALRREFAGRSVVLAGGVASMWRGHVEHLRAVGVGRVLVVAPSGAGAGPPPDVNAVVLDPEPASSAMEAIRAASAVLGDPPAEVVDAIDRFDPDGSSACVGHFLNPHPELCGRPFLAHRRPEWVALEDKVLVDELWDRAGVGRQPAEVVPVAEAQDAADRIDAGRGTVWSADARDGFHGGGHLTRWVVDAATSAAAADELSASADRVRVMPFVDGIPCSIHGIVLPDGVAVLRPVEMVTLRAGSRLVYAGCATLWDPPHRIREQMRDVARRVGELLAAEVGFRGAFTVDGVVAADGFWPTELNPRYGAGLNVIATAIGLPLELLCDLVVGGRPLGRDADGLERELVALADRRRGGGTWMFGHTADRDPPGPAMFRGGRWSWVGDDEADAQVVVGPSFVRCDYVADRIPEGPPTAPLAAEFWRFADRELGLGVEPVSPAPDPFAP